MIHDGGFHSVTHWLMLSIIVSLMNLFDCNPPSSRTGQDYDFGQTYDKNRKIT